MEDYMEKNSVCAVVVTFNRKDLLEECLDAIFNQTIGVNKLIIIDNASTDGTEELIRSKYLEKPFVTYLKQNKNLGGSGGFFEGMKKASKTDCEYVWIMDDDTIPTSTALEEFLKANNYLNSKGEKISFLASSVRGINEQPMNLPTVDTRPLENGNSDWYKHLKNGMVKITVATFVSLLIKCDAIRECGLPCKDYFIWGDDSEYTLRLTKFYGDAYFIGFSEVIHKRKGSGSLNINEVTDKKRLKNYYYMIRNNLINTRYYFGIKKAIFNLLKNYLSSFKLLFSSFGLSKFLIIHKGIISYIFQYRKFKRYIDAQLNS